MNLEDAIESTAELMGIARETVLIYDGHFDPKIYQCDKVARGMYRAARRGIKIEVICDRTAQLSHPTILDLIQKKLIQVYITDFNKGWLNHIGRGHYMLVDGWYSRIEESHNLSSDKRRAVINFSDENVEKYKKRFNEKKATSTLHNA